MLNLFKHGNYHEVIKYVCTINGQQIKLFTHDFYT